MGGRGVGGGSGSAGGQQRGWWVWGIRSSSLHPGGSAPTRHVGQRRVDAALRRHGVAAGGEELGDAGGVEAVLRQAHRRAQPSAACTDSQRHARAGKPSQRLVGTQRQAAYQRVCSTRSGSCRRPPPPAAATLVVAAGCLEFQGDLSRCGCALGWPRNWVVAPAAGRPVVVIPSPALPSACPHLHPRRLHRTRVLPSHSRSCCSGSELQRRPGCWSAPAPSAPTRLFASAFWRYYYDEELGFCAPDSKRMLCCAAGPLNACGIRTLWLLRQSPKPVAASP